MQTRLTLRGGIAAGALVCAPAVLVTLLPAPARADCVQTGTTVTCTAPGTGGYQNASGDGLTVNVQSSATVTDNGTAAILLRDRNTIINNGAITAIGTADGINAGADNTVTNNGGISVADGNAINLGTNTSLPAAANITNNGTITVTNFGFGITVGASHRVVNNGTITAGNGIGIKADTQNVVTNNGTITAGSAGITIQLVNPGNQLYNFGTLSASGGGSALDICGCATGTLAENKSGGTIDGYITVDGSGNTLRNSGLIQVTGSTLQGFPTFFISNQGGFGAGNSFAQTSTGTLALRMDNTGTIDNLSADAITPGGTVKIVIQPQLYSSQTFSGTAITISGYGLFLGNTINAPFDHYISSSPFFTVTPLYDTNDPTNYQAINFQLNRIPFGSVPGATDNQRAIGNALEAGYSTSLTGTFATFYSNLLAVSSLTALDQLSGAGTTATQNAAFGAAGLFNGAMTQQGLAWLTGAADDGGFGAPLQYAADRERKPGHEAFAAMQPHVAKPPEWRAWSLGFGSTRTIDGNSSAGSADQSLQTAGGAIGVERTFGGAWLFGFAAGGSSSSFSVSSLSTSGHIDGGHVGAYGVTRWGDIYALTTLNYAHFDNSTDRTITGVGATENAHGRFASDQLGGRFELGWRRRIAGFAVTPFVAIEPAALWQQAYTETSTTSSGGSGILGLSYASHETTSLPTFLGAQIDARYDLGNDRILAPSARLSWVHEFRPDRQIEASLVTLSTPTFTVDGPRAARDALRTDLGLTLGLAQNVALFARFNGEFSNTSTMYAGAAGARITW